jgi:predicted RNA-binding Zn-ribbon protein involved in translation (DUF1610 family)
MAMWDTEALWLKARTYIDKANALEHDNPDFGLSSALALEFLGRAALSHIHPALNADPKDEKNLFYSLGLQLVEQPRSIPLHSVSARLENFIPAFVKPQRTVFDYMALRRNVELHTGDLGFVGVHADSWLPRFYAACKVLCESMGKTLADLFGGKVGSAAEKIVAAFANAQEKTVKDRISKHAKEFAAKPAEERKKLAEEAEARTMMLPLGRVAHDCPACGSQGILAGKLIKESEPVYEEGELLVKLEYLADEFRCPACGLHLTSIDEVGLSGIDLHFTETTSTSLHENFQPEWEDEYENM